jgi:hypothetical protein
MPVARPPLVLTVTTFALFVTGNVLGWVTHDPQSAGDWGSGGSTALAAISLALLTFSVVGAPVAPRHPANATGRLRLHPGSLPATMFAPGPLKDSAVTAAPNPFGIGGGAARMQMNWLASATAAIVLVYAVVVAIGGGSGPAPTWLQGLQDGTVLSFCLIPVAIGGVTLLVVASFQPLRTRIRSAVDGRFHRSRYDAEGAAAGFSGRLRSQVDLDAVHSELLAVVHATVQPSHAELWLRTDSEERPWNASPSATT